MVAEDGTQGILIFKKQEEKGDSMGEKTDEVLREPSEIPVMAKQEEYSKRLTTEALTSSLTTPFIPNLKARISEVSKNLVLKYRVQQTSTCVMVWLLILDFSTIYKPKQASLIYEEKYRDT